VGKASRIDLNIGWTQLHQHLPINLYIRRHRRNSRIFWATFWRVRQSPVRAPCASSADAPSSSNDPAFGYGLPRLL